MKKACQDDKRLKFVETTIAWRQSDTHPMKVTTVDCRCQTRSLQFSWEVGSRSSAVRISLSDPEVSLMHEQLADRFQVTWQCEKESTLMCRCRSEPAHCSIFSCPLSLVSLSSRWRRGPRGTFNCLSSNRASMLILIFRALFHKQVKSFVWSFGAFVFSTSICS
jgi:hypothetical protein